MGWRLIDLVISEEEANGMVTKVTKEGITRMLFKMNKDKAPGLDGFEALFFQKAWNVVRNDVIETIQNFFSSSKMLKELNCA